MKIAICISGFLRTWEQTKKSFMEQLTKNADVDVFVHTYKQNLYEFTAEEKDTEFTEENFRKLFEGVNLIALVAEDREAIYPIITQESKRFENVSIYDYLQQESSDPDSKKVPIGIRTYDHLRKIHLCNELRKQYEKESGVQYDVVIKTRSDLVYFNTPNWNMCLDGKIHTGIGATWGYPRDTFCATTPKVMDKVYASRFLHLDDMLLNEDGTPKEGASFCSHFTLKYMYKLYNPQIGEPVVNINCFRSKNSFQYYGTYRKKYDLHKFYEKVTSKGLQNVYEIEKWKNEILPHTWDVTM